MELSTRNCRKSRSCGQTPRTSSSPLGPEPHPALRRREWSGKRDSNPRPSAWKADALPLSYSRSNRCTAGRWWRGKDSNLRRHRRQIYSLLPLATRAPLLRGRALHTAPLGARKRRAGEGTRTPNRLITNEMLYQLSYASARRGVRPGQDREALPGCQASRGIRPPAKRQPWVDGPCGLLRRSWLPLPEKAVNDRVQTPPPPRLR